MALLYAAARIDALGYGPSQEQGEQRDWLKSRDERCSKEAVSPCLVDVYDQRLNELAVAALFRAPTFALAELERQEPKAAPLYEAIYRYATIADTAERTRVVEQLIAPAFADIRSQPTASILFAEIPNAHAAAASDRAFGTFLDVASVSDYELTMPCAAMVRRPGLINALGSHYGGSIDGQLIGSDCDSVMPGTPSLDGLKESAEAAQPFCQGTIRISLTRDYERTLVAIRLHRSDMWKPGDPYVSKRPAGDDSDDGPADDAPFRVQNRVKIGKAVTELAKYYSTIFNVSTRVARTEASSAINTVITGAYSLCE